MEKENDKRKEEEEEIVKRKGRKGNSKGGLEEEKEMPRSRMEEDKGERQGMIRRERNKKWGKHELDEEVKS